MSATFILTFDFELGWGAIENGRWKAREQAAVYDRLRPVLKTLLNYLDQLEIPATWATVAGMLDARAVEHLDHLPSSLRDRTRKALQSCRQSSFDGRDLADLVEGARFQRLASHSFSHMRFSYPEVDAQTIDTEMKLCQQVWSERGWAVDTFVFPQNHEGFFDVLAANGIVKVRGAEHAPRRSLPVRLWSNTVSAPPLSRKTNRSGIDVETGSLFYKVSAEQKYRLPLIEMQMKRGLALAQKRNGIFHLYLHPFNLAEFDPLFDSFRRMLESIAIQRDSGQLDLAVF